MSEALSTARKLLHSVTKTAVTQLIFPGELHPHPPDSPKNPPVYAGR